MWDETFRQQIEMNQFQCLYLAIVFIFYIFILLCVVFVDKLV